MEGKLIEWALSIINSAPPIQNMAAFAVVLLAAVPMLLSGIRRFRGAISPPPLPLPAPAVDMIQQTPWLIQMVTTIQLDIESLQKTVDAHGRSTNDVRLSVAALDRIMRKVHDRLFQEPRDDRGHS